MGLRLPSALLGAGPCVLLAVAVVATLILGFSTAPAGAEEEDGVLGTELNYDQCREAGGFDPGTGCRDHDPEEAAEILERDNAETDQENQDLAEGDEEIESSDLSPEECREAGGTHLGNRCEDFDQDAARDVIADRDSGSDPSNPDEESLSDRRGDGDTSRGDGDTSMVVDMMVGAWDQIWGLAYGAIENYAEVRAEQLSGALVDGRYMIEPPTEGLQDIYTDTADWAKPGAIALLLLLGLSMIFRSADYNTAYAAQYGLPRIITVVAGIAFLPDIVDLLAELTRSIADQIADEQQMADGFERLLLGHLEIPPGFTLIVLIIKLILGLLLLFAIAVQTLVFGILYVIGPFAILFHAIPGFSEVAVAWLKGVLACFAISVGWALLFGIGFRFVADPELVGASSGAWGLLPVLLSIGVLWAAWKLPWHLFSLAFASYRPGGGTSGALRTAGLIKILSKPRS